MRRKGPLKGSELMLGSEGARHLIALIAVAAAVGAQSLVTRSAVADQDRQAVDFGVRLLTAELPVPASQMSRKPLALPQSLEEPNQSAATFLASTKGPTTFDPALKRQRNWLDARPFELRRRDVSAYRTLDRHLLNRDAVGSLIELTENDVLIPVRLER